MNKQIIIELLKLIYCNEASFGALLREGMINKDPIGWATKWAEQSNIFFVVNFAYNYMLRLYQKGASKKKAISSAAILLFTIGKGRLNVKNALFMLQTRWELYNPTFSTAIDFRML